MKKFLRIVRLPFVIIIMVCTVPLIFVWMIIDFDVIDNFVDLKVWKEALWPPIESKDIIV